MPEDPQIGGWMRPEEQAEFMKYLDQFHLGVGAVPTLLVVRELQCARLPRLSQLYPMPPGKGRKRVSARPRDLGLKRDFEAHVTKFGLDRDPCAAILFRAELQERWLERSIQLESG